ELGAGEGQLGGGRALEALVVTQGPVWHAVSIAQAGGPGVRELTRAAQAPQKPALDVWHGETAAPPQTNRHGGAPSGAPEGRFVGEGDTMSQIRNVLALLLALTLAFALAQGDDQGQSEAGAMASEFEFLSLELVAEGFVSPVTLTAPAGDDRLFLVDR